MHLTWLKWRLWYLKCVYIGLYTRTGEQLRSIRNNYTNYYYCYYHGSSKFLKYNSILCIENNKNNNHGWWWWWCCDDDRNVCRRCHLYYKSGGGGGGFVGGDRSIKSIWNAVGIAECIRTVYYNKLNRFVSACQWKSFSIIHNIIIK